MKKKITLFIFLIFVFFTGIFAGIFFALRSKKYENKKIYELFSTAEKLKKKEKFEEAILAYKVLVDTYPDSQYAPLSLYEAAKITEFYMKDFEKAKKIYSEIVKKYKNSKFYSKAMNKLREKSNFYKKVIKDYPAGVYSPQEILKYYRKIPEMVAIQELEFIIEGYESWKEKKNFMFALAKIYKMNKDYENSLKVFEKLFSEYPESNLSFLSYLEVSDIYYRVNDQKNAFYFLERFEKSDLYKKFQNLINYGKGEIFYKEKRYRNAENFYKKIEENFLILPQNYFSGKEPLLKLAEIHTKENRYRESLKCYQNFLKKYRSLPSANPQKVNYLYLKIGNLYFLLDEKEEAERMYQKIINSTCSEKEILSEAIYRTGILREMKGEIVPSSYYEDILKKYNSFIIIPCYYKYIKTFQKEFKETTPPPSLREIEEIEEKIAKTYGEKIIKKTKEKLYSENNILYHFIIGDIYYYQGNYRKAKDKFNFILKLTSDVRIAYPVVNTFSIKFFECGKYLEKISLREKVEYLEKENLKKEDVKNYLELSKLYKKLNWYEDSMKCYEKIASFDGEILNSLYEENLKILKEELWKISSNLYSQIEFILNTEYPENKRVVLERLKIDCQKYLRTILEFLPGVYAGTKGKIEVEESEIESLLEIDLKKDEYQKNYKFLFTKDGELLEKQKNILKGMLQMVKILKEIVKMKDYKEMKKDYSGFFRDFPEEYLK